jgi:hypothetical protein
VFSDDGALKQAPTSHANLATGDSVSETQPIYPSLHGQFQFATFITTHYP